MRNILFKKLKDEKGQNLVEFALVVVFLLAIFFAIAEFGRAWYKADRLKNAANTAARITAVNKNYTGTAKQEAISVAGDGVTIFYSFTSSSVKATAKYHFRSSVPSFMQMIGGFGNYTIRRDATYRLEQ